MRIRGLLFTTLAAVLVATSGAFADAKQDALDEYNIKPWSISDLPQLTPLADVYETEPLNDTCPGEPYLAGDVFHGSLTTGDDDWISFSCEQGFEITIGTDSDGTGDDVDTVIELWDDVCGTMLTSNDDGGPGLYSLIQDYVAPYTGTYTLKVRGYGGTSTGDYQLLGACVDPNPVIPGFCPIGMYKGSKINVHLAVPDNDPVGLVTPAIKFNPQPGCAIADVVIDLEMEHTWVGDLIVTLRYTSYGGAVLQTDLIQRPGVPPLTYGCSGNLIADPEDKYYFGTRPDLVSIGEPDCPSEIEPQCYAVAPENPNGLEIFRGLPIGDGIWELIITDNAGGDLGYVVNWSVHILCEAPVSVEGQSWGQTKAQYR